MPTAADTPASDLDPAVLRRARLQAELAGLDSLKAAKAVTQARRRHRPDDQQAVTFWHALYVELAPLSTMGKDLERGDPGPQRALLALSLEERTTLLLRVSERLSISAIGAVLDEPDDRVRGHLALAVKRLRLRLAAGREDRLWIGEVETWLAQHATAGARPKHGDEAAELAAPMSPAALNQPHSPADGHRRRSRLSLWLGLVAVLAAVGVARMSVDRWIAQTGPQTEPVVVVDPLIAWLQLPAEDAELVENIEMPAAVAQMDFLLWLEQTDPSHETRKDADATP